MNKVGIKGKGESVWLGFFLYNIIEGFNKIIKKSKVTFDTTKFINFNSKLKDNLNKKAWDGEYYLRAFYDNGDKLGSHENNECKIDLISQSFSIISDVINKERIDPVIKSVEEKLVDDDLGIVKLLTPPFDKTLNNPGYIMNYSKGIRENGGQYTHAVSWYLMALIKTGYHDRAYRYFQMINPINRTTDKESSDIYRVEPYVIAADIYSSKTYPGRGGWTWYTGSAGWFYRVGVQDILGINKYGDKLQLNPNLPISWNNVSIKYTYMDTVYNIEVKKDKNDSIKLDGKDVKNDTITLNNDRREHSIVITYNAK
jgi:cellobiose phosphorylase